MRFLDAGMTYSGTKDSSKRDTGKAQPNYENVTELAAEARDRSVIEGRK
jgi:hypothetical protein